MGTNRVIRLLKFLMTPPKNVLIQGAQLFGFKYGGNVYVLKSYGLMYIYVAYAKAIW